MCKPKLKEISTPIAIGNNSHVISINYDLEKLIIILDIDNQNKLLEIIFEDQRGFRVLDEGDLCRYWTAGKRTESVVEVLGNGWLEYESKGHLEVTSSSSEYKEFLISGMNECVSILSLEAPILRVINGT